MRYVPASCKSHASAQEPHLALRPALLPTCLGIHFSHLALWSHSVQPWSWQLPLLTATLALLPLRQWALLPWLCSWSCPSVLPHAPPECDKPPQGFSGHGLVHPEAPAARASPLSLCLWLLICLHSLPSCSLVNNDLSFC